MNDTTLTVSGMNCRSCVGRIDKALRGLEGVAEVDVELRSGTVRIRHAPTLTAKQLADRASAAGYPSRVVDSP